MIRVIFTPARKYTINFSNWNLSPKSMFSLCSYPCFEKCIKPNCYWKAIRVFIPQRLISYLSSINA